MSTNSIPKYRPVLSAEQINTIMHLCKTTLPLTSKTMDVIATLAPFQAKIENAGVIAAYSMTPPQSIEDKLGFSTPEISVSPEEKRYQAFIKYDNNPSSCSIHEIEMAQTYRYENRLMTVEETTAFEKGEL